MDPIALEQLAYAYFRRKRWEAELQAGWIIRLLAEAINGDSSTGAPNERVSPESLLASMGVAL